MCLLRVRIDSGVVRRGSWSRFEGVGGCSCPSWRHKRPLLTIVSFYSSIFLPLLFSSVVFLYMVWWVHTAEEVLMDLLAIRLGNEPAVNMSIF